MTSSEIPATMESWLYRGSPLTDTWLSESFARDTETLTRALQQSLSSDLPPLSITAPAAAAPSRSGSDPEPAPPRRRIPVAAKPTKRRSRASKRETTTFITADPANFRQMVQQVTGVRFSGYQASAVLKPEPQRAVGNQAYNLPTTLDTSSFLMESACPSFCPVSVPPPDGGVGFDFESFSCFPTLESGKVMY